MKKITVIIMALAFVLGMTQCRKQVETMVQPADETMDVIVRVENGDDKTDITATGVVTWKENDRLYVVGTTDGLLGTVSATSNGNPVNFQGKIKVLSTDQVLRFYYVGDKVFSFDGSGNYKFDISSQDGTLNSVAAHNQLMFGKTSGTIAPGVADFGTISMRSLMSIAHFNINADGKGVSAVEMTGGFASSTFNAKTYDGTTDIPGTAGTITMTFTSSTASTDCYMALLPGTQTLAFSGEEGLAYLGVQTVAANKFYHHGGNAITVAIETPENSSQADPFYDGGWVQDGCLNGNFSVGPGVTVRFSKGNLQYQGSTGVWRFAEHQYDYVGGETTGNVYVGTTKSNNACIAPDYSGWIDMFGWGTTGVAHMGYGAMNKPWSTGETPSDYGPVAGNLSVPAGSDWGCVMNQGNAGWRTLTKDEWEYLIDTRIVNGDSGEGKTYNCATINKNETDGSEVYGVLLYPDGYTKQTSAQEYTKSEWEAMEHDGVVFLPAAAYRAGTDFFDVWVGLTNYYWSSTSFDSNQAYTFFNTGGFVGAAKIGKYVGMSVRLVR